MTERSHGSKAGGKGVSKKLQPHLLAVFEVLYNVPVKPQIINSSFLITKRQFIGLALSISASDRTGVQKRK